MDRLRSLELRWPAIGGPFLATMDQPRKTCETMEFRSLLKDLGIFWFLFVTVSVVGVISTALLALPQEVALGLQPFDRQGSTLVELRPEAFADIPGVQSASAASRPAATDHADGCAEDAVYLTLNRRGSIFTQSRLLDQLSEVAVQQGLHICALGFFTGAAAYDSVGLALFFGSLPMLGVLLLLWALSVKYARVRKNFFDWQPEQSGTKAISAGLAVGLLLFLAIAAFLKLLTGDGTYNPFEEFRGSNIVLLMMVLGVSAPVIEEYLFRAVLLHRLANSLNQYIALIVTSIVFAAAHFPSDWVVAIALLVIGIALGLLWLTTRSLLACVLAHSTYNLAAVAFILLA